MDDIAADLGRQLRASQERHIQSLVGLRVRHTASVRLVKPRWMPNRLYMRLMRSIVVIDGPTVIGNF